jgi:hypothetical protein
MLQSSSRYLLFMLHPLLPIFTLFLLETPPSLVAAAIATTSNLHTSYLFLKCSTPLPMQLYSIIIHP